LAGDSRQTQGSTATRFLELLDVTGVYAVTDDSLSRDRMLEAVRILLDAGVRLFQYRDKLQADGQRAETASILAGFVRGAGGLLIVNDRVDIALAAGADGAHLGQDDLPIDKARAMFGSHLVLGASASYPSELEPAGAAGADYIGFGAVFGTDTKPDAEYAGLDLLEEACRQTMLPVVGIGGITIDRVADVIRRGAAGVAVVSALFRADDPHAAARRLLAAVRQARAG
jgi:thiamine-phosphate diphosphorylase